MDDQRYPKQAFEARPEGRKKRKTKSEVGRKYKERTPGERSGLEAG
jgi:hypothetical protein